MHRTAEWVSADTPVCDVATRILKNEIGAMPVGKDDRTVGMITNLDLAMRVLTNKLNAATTRAEDIMTPGIIYCRTADGVKDAVQLMSEYGIRRLPPLDKTKRLTGMLSLCDVAYGANLRVVWKLIQAVASHHR